MLLAALTALAVRALVVAKLPAPPVGDGATFARLALHLAHGDGFVRDAPAIATAWEPVGYPALVALVTVVSRLSVALAAQSLNLVAAAVAAACAASLGYRVAASRGGYLAGLAYALAPGPALWSAATMPETVDGALMIAAVCAAVVPVTATRARVGVAALAGALTGLGALIRPHAVLAAPFLGALSPAPRRTRWVAGTVCVVAALAWMLPWTARNCATMGSCALVTTRGGDDLLQGTRDVGEVDATTCTSAPNEAARDRCATRRAVERIAADPIAWARRDALKLYRSFAYEWAPVSYVREASTGAFAGDSASRAAAICTAWWWALVVCAILGGRRASRVGGRTQALVRIVILEVVLVALTRCIFQGDDRAHLPLVPLLAPMAAGILLPVRPGAEPELVWAG